MQLVEYIRICVDDDIAVARQSYAQSLMGYALGDSVPSDRLRRFAYRAHFERMGFTEQLAELDGMRQRGASGPEVAAAMPEELLTRVGYYGSAAGARAAFATTLGDGLDTAIVRVVAAKPWASRFGPGGDARVCAQRLIGADRLERVGEDLHGVVDLRLGGGGRRHEAQH